MSDIPYVHRPSGALVIQHVKSYPTHYGVLALFLLAMFLVPTVSPLGAVSPAGPSAGGVPENGGSLTPTTISSGELADDPSDDADSPTTTAVAPTTSRPPVAAPTTSSPTTTTTAVARPTPTSPPTTQPAPTTTTTTQPPDPEPEPDPIGVPDLPLG